MINIITALGLIIAWWTYRQNIVAKRRNYLIALEELLNATGIWFGNAYMSDAENDGWKDPSYMVYRVDISLINSVIIEGGYIFGDNFIKNLVQFVQLVTRFNQYVDTHIDFVNSNYEKLKEPGDNFFKRRAYALMKKLHIVGIGSDGFHSNPRDFPFLHKSFNNLKKNIEDEKAKNVRILYWNRFFLFDIFFVLIPILYVAYETFHNLNFKFACPF